MKGKEGEEGKKVQKIEKEINVGSIRKKKEREMGELKKGAGKKGKDTGDGRKAKNFHIIKQTNNVNSKVFLLKSPIANGKRKKEKRLKLKK